MKNTKIAMLIVCLLVAFIGLAYVGIRSFTQSIYQQKNCEWANIDNIEIRTMVDIPKFQETECSFDSISNSKKVMFVLDQSVDINTYRTKNNLQKLTDRKTLAAFRLEDHAKTNIENLYFREKTTTWESYKILLDADSRKLWIDLQYLD